jgi:hypothetical protein
MIWVINASIRYEIYWNLTNAKFGSGPESMEGFYLVVNQEMVLLLGDVKREAYRRLTLTLTLFIPMPFLLLRGSTYLGKCFMG